MKPSAKTIAKFKGTTVVLTGAASGIGRSLARLLIECGATVHALDLNEEGLADLAVESPVAGAIHCHPVDVTDFQTYGEVVARIFEISDRIDFLFNNAGVTLLGEALNLPFERWKWLLDINLMGTVNGISLIYPKMIAAGRGHIVNTASIAGSTGYATASAYTASKAAILELSRSLGVEAKYHGVKVSSVCPGYVDSGIFSQDRIVGVDKEKMIRELPVKMMSPEEAAGRFLAGVARGRMTVIFPFSAKFLWYLSRWMPSMMTPFHKRFLRTFDAG